jgi:hypothetical protein
VIDTGDDDNNRPEPAIASWDELVSMILHSPRMLGIIALMFLAVGCIVASVIALVVMVS